MVKLRHDDDVIRADISHAILLTTRQGLEIRIETKLRIKNHGVETVMQPDDLGHSDAEAGNIFLGPLKLINFDDFGQLEMIYRKGMTLLVAPHPDFEAWTITAKDGSMVVASPGGGFVSFPPRA